MKIGIVTIYESITNLGSFLQAFALKSFLESKGHEVYFIQNKPTLKTGLKCVLKLNPKREFFLRIIKTLKFFEDTKKLKLVAKNDLSQKDFDVLIYGSDEIWNLENKYFADGLFWGEGADTINKIAYAISIGALEDETAKNYTSLTDNIKDFNNIFSRDERTVQFVENITSQKTPLVCDPTILLPLNDYIKPIKLPKEKYLLVYTYGVDKNMQDRIINFARKHNLKIVSPCFWHIWADKIIECSALQFSSLIAGAEYVFTSTFHGAIFTMLNHKKCCILPVREKVSYVVKQFDMQEHLINPNITDEQFEEVITREFNSELFEKKITLWREKSQNMLLEALNCLEK